MNSTRFFFRLVVATALLSVPVVVGCVEVNDGDEGGGDGNGDGLGDGADGVDGGDGGEPLASEAEVDACKDACDKLKFFDCIDSGEHAQCWDACGRVDSDAIELFDACVSTDVCDASCFDQLVDAQVPVGDDDDDDDDVGGGPGCLTACNAINGACFEGSIDCAALCSVVTPEQETLIEYCNEARDGCDFPEECYAAFEEVDEGGGGEGGEEGGGWGEEG